MLIGIGRLYGEDMEKVKIMWLPRTRHVYLLGSLPVLRYGATRQLMAVSTNKVKDVTIEVSPDQADAQTVVKTDAKPAVSLTPDEELRRKTEAAKPDALLLKEMDETNNWARLGGQLYFGWFTLMVTINGIAIGWLFNNKSTVPRFARVMFFIFFILNLMGTITTILIRNHMLECDRRIQDVLGGLTRDRASEANYFAPLSPVPRRAVNTVCAFTCAVLFMLLLFWMILALWPEALLA